MATAASIPQPWRTVYGRQGWISLIADCLLDIMAGRPASRPTEEPEFKAKQTVRYRFISGAAWYWYLHENPISPVLRKQHRERIVQLAKDQFENGWWTAGKSHCVQGAGEAEASFLLLSAIAMLRGGLQFGHEDVAEAWADVIGGTLRLWDRVATEDGEIVMPCIGSLYPVSFAATTCYRLLRGLPLKGYTGRPIAEWPEAWNKERHLAGPRILRDLLQGFKREQLFGRDDQLQVIPLRVPLVVVRRPGTIYARLVKNEDDDTKYDLNKVISETAVRIVKPGQHEVATMRGWAEHDAAWPEWAEEATNSVNGQYVTYDSRRD